MSAFASLLLFLQLCPSKCSFRVYLEASFARAEREEGIENWTNSTWLSCSKLLGYVVFEWEKGRHKTLFSTVWIPFHPPDCNKPLKSMSAKQHVSSITNCCWISLELAGNLLNLSDESWHRNIRPSISSTSDIFLQLLSAMTSICKLPFTFNWHKKRGKKARSKPRNNKLPL